MEQLQDRVAVVTGAASGIGLAMCETFQAEGMKLVMADVEAAALDAAAGRLGATGEVLAVRTDVSNAEEVDALRDAALARFGAVHVVCNNAGVGGGGPLDELPLSTWRWVLGVNLWGVIHGVHSFLPGLVAQGEGHIVNTGSIAGLTSFPNMAAYNVSKHGVVTLSETLYSELAASGSEVGVTVLCPGFVATRIIDSDRNRPESLAQPLAEPDPDFERIRAVVKELYTQQKPPAEVAPLVVAAIRSKRLYCYTDDQFAPTIAARHRHIDAGTNPEPTPPLFEKLIEGSR